jgi:hypothetical protein
MRAEKRLIWKLNAKISLLVTVYSLQFWRRERGLEELAALLGSIAESLESPAYSTIIIIIMSRRVRRGISSSRGKPQPARNRQRSSGINDTVSGQREGRPRR